MYCIGDVNPDWKKLVDVTKECVEVGIKHVIPWTFLGDMGEAIHAHALDHGYSIVREIGGHGCGNEFHEDPFVSYVSTAGTEMLMVPGMVFTIEPMVNMGTDRICIDDKNGWTVYTQDGKPSAQWEVEVLVTETGCEVLCW
jgi:methionyl aminopeptidase